jgi:hypothetical protein
MDATARPAPDDAQCGGLMSRLMCPRRSRMPTGQEPRIGIRTALLPLMPLQLRDRRAGVSS